MMKRGIPREAARVKSLVVARNLELKAHALVSLVSAIIQITGKSKRLADRPEAVINTIRLLRWEQVQLVHFVAVVWLLYFDVQISKQ